MTDKKTQDACDHVEKSRVLVADPPWSFKDPLPGKKRGAAKHYALMNLSDICNFSLPPLHDDALLFLWRVSSMQSEALEVMNAWGFTLKSEIVWVKTTKNNKLFFGMGRYVRNCHEVCLIGRRGKASVQNRSVRSVFFSPAGRHSEKPDLFYDLVEDLSGGPYTEIFARRKRKGWRCYGNEID